MKSCKTCEHGLFELTADQKLQNLNHPVTVGLCTAHPPTVQVLPVPMSNGSQTGYIPRPVTCWPEVEETRLCGEWQPKALPNSKRPANPLVAE